MENNRTEQSNGKDQYELKRLRKMGQKMQSRKKGTMRNWAQGVVFLAIIVVIIGGIWWYAASFEKTPESEIISKRGIHWHTNLEISVNGEKREVPANLGIGGGHGLGSREIHTHDTTGELHLEKTGFVTVEDTRLKTFFDIWGKDFNASCILEYCIEEGKTLKMRVNGEENGEYENYAMKDGDRIEIIYE